MCGSVYNTCLCIKKVHFCKLNQVYRPTFAYMNLCKYVYCICMYICLYVYLSISMFVCIYIYIYIWKVPLLHKKIWSHYAYIYVYIHTLMLRLYVVYLYIPTTHIHTVCIYIILHNLHSHTHVYVCVCFVYVLNLDICRIKSEFDKRYANMLMIANRQIDIKTYIHTYINSCKHM